MFFKFDSIREIGKIEKEKQQPTFFTPTMIPRSGIYDFAFSTNDLHRPPFDAPKSITVGEKDK